MTADHLIESALRGEAPRWPERTDAFESAVIEAAEGHGVTALLAAAPVVQTWPGRVRTALADSLRAEAPAEAIRRKDLRELLAELALGGIRPLLLKGGHIAYTRYPSPWLRSRLDTDLMVATGDRLRADEVLRAMGYRPSTSFAGDLVSHQFQYERPNRYGVGDHVDLHWRVANPHVFAGVFSFEELERRSVAIDALGPDARGLSVADALVVACLHRVAHHNNSNRLIWLYDIHLLARAIPADEWDGFVDLVLDKRLGSVCSNGVAQAQKRFGTAVPQRALDRLQSGDRDEPTAAFLRPGLTKLDVLRSDLGALEGWRSKLRIIQEHLFPPVAYIRRAYNISNPAIVPLAYAVRIAKGVGKWGKRQA